jgi:ribosome-binding protein aMBF1 (putative translation factor)
MTLQCDFCGSTTDVIDYGLNVRGEETRICEECRENADWEPIENV